MGASATTANAYIADVSKPENRARNFGLIGVAFGLGFIFGPAIGGLLGSIDLRLPFFASAGLALLNWLYGFFVLPESLPPGEARRLPLAQGQSGGQPPCARVVSAGGGAHCGLRFRHPRPARARDRLGSLHRAQVRVGRAGQRPVAGPRGGHVGGRPGWGWSSR